MLDLKWIRQNPEKFDAAMLLRNNEIKAKQILEFDKISRENIRLLQEMQAKKNEIVKKMPELKKEYARIKKEIEDGQIVDVAVLDRLQNAMDNLQNASKELSENIEGLQESNSGNPVFLEEILISIPNVPHESVPIGKGEEENLEIEKFGMPKEFSFTPKSHVELGEGLKMLDFEQSALMSGARFSTLSGNLARLERALSNFMIDVALEHDYLEISPPNLVKSEAMKISGQLPKFAEEAFSTSDGYWLIPTSEVSLVNLAAKKTFSENELPLRFVAYTPCFRREAGAAGKDTRGMIRQHQFKKVELVSITTAEQSEVEHERMTAVSCEILKRLQLPFRKLLLCSGDMGFSAQKTYDLEVWLPSQTKYREISSCSNCGDFQARRGAIKYKNKSDGKTYFAHTLNGSALAVGRTLLAILENYQNQDGTVAVPEVLVNYMNNIKKISC